MAAKLALFLLLSITFGEAAIRSFEWNVTWATVAPDCVTKNVVTINGQYPGPEISAVEGDRIVVKLCNNIYHGVTMHW